MFFLTRRLSAGTDNPWRRRRNQSRKVLNNDYDIIFRGLALLARQLLRLEAGTYNHLYIVYARTYRAAGRSINCDPYLVVTLSTAEHCNRMIFFYYVFFCARHNYHLKIVRQYWRARRQLGSIIMLSFVE